MPSHKTALGRSIGSLLQSGASFRNKGYMEGMRASAYEANAEESLAKAAKTAAEQKLLDRQAGLGSDAGIRNIAEISSGTDNDLARMIEQNLRNENVPLDALPAETDFYPGYKGAKQNERALMAQLMAGLGAGDKSVDLQKTLKGVTENVINGRLRMPGADVGSIANALSAFAGKGQDTQQGVALERVNKTPGIDPIVAALASMGKDALGERENDKMQSQDRRRGDDIQSQDRRYGIGVSAASSRYNTDIDASTSRRNTDVSQATERWKHTTPGASGSSNDVFKIRDDIRAQYSVEYPKGITGDRDNAPTFDQYERQQLKRLNVDEAKYYGKKTDSVKATTSDKKRAYDEYVTAFKSEKDPERRKRMTDFARSKGLLK